MVWKLQFRWDPVCYAAHITLNGLLGTLPNILYVTQAHHPDVIPSMTPEFWDSLRVMDDLMRLAHLIQSLSETGVVFSVEILSTWIGFLLTLKLREAAGCRERRAPRGFPQKLKVKYWRSLHCVLGTRLLSFVGRNFIAGMRCACVLRVKMSKRLFPASSVDSIC